MEFIEDYFELLQEARQGEIHILFYDPVHQLHNSESGNCRIKKWEEVYLKSNTWRKRITAMWGINPLTLVFSGLIIEDYCDTETTKKTLEIIREDYPDGKPIFIFLDNAAYNRSYEVQERARELGIILYYLPPYSPNLNLIERLWKFMKKKLVKNRYYETLDEFRSVFLDFFSNLWIYYSELENIFDNKFQILKAV
jgi:transposase